MPGVGAAMVHSKAVVSRGGGGLVGGWWDALD